MSGGSYEYLCFRIEEAAHELKRRRPTVLRKAFAAHMMLIADAMHAIEWEDSGDGADEETAIRKCLVPGAELESARVALEQAIKDAEEVLTRCGS